MTAVVERYPWVTHLPAAVRVRGETVDATCPVCGKPYKLWFRLGRTGHLVFGCWRGCDKDAVMRAFGFRGLRDAMADGVTESDFPKRKFKELYSYRDEAGVVLYQTLRYEPGGWGKRKSFSQRRPDGAGGWVNDLAGVRFVLYRLPELLAAPAAPVYVVAGEKDANALAALGFAATTNVGGEARGWREEYSAALAGRPVVVVEDADAVGRRHADEVCGGLMRHAGSVRRVKFPAKDTSEFLDGLRAAGVTAAGDLAAAVRAAAASHPAWRPVSGTIPEFG